MTAYGTMQESEAFRNLCRALEIDYNTTNKVAKNLEEYRNSEEFGKIIEDSKKFIGVIDSVSPHPCFVAGEYVMTSNGLKEIQDIKIGDEVLTHNNRFRKVLKTMNSVRTDIYDIKVMGSPTTRVTSNHPYYVRDMSKKKGQRIFSEPYWCDVRDLEKGKYVGVAINNESIIPKYHNVPTHMKEFWWLIGRYIGDGWWKNLRPNHKTHGEYCVTICCNKNEKGEIEEFADKLKNYFNYYITNERTTLKYHFLSKSLWNFVQQFGKGAKNKKLTNDIFNLPEDLLKSFIDGYISADGYINKNGKIQVTTVSRELAFGIQSCIHKAYRRPVGITKTKRKDTTLEGRILKGNIQYIIQFRKESVKSEQAFYEDGYIWTPFRSKELTGEKEITYNIEVDEDNSYTVNNLIVHNCANLLLSEPISEEIGIIKVGNEYCALIDSGTSDDWKYLKNDYLTVTVWEIISKVFKKINKPIPDVRTLTKLVENNDRIWQLYEKGLTATLNQAGTDSGTPQVMQYKPRNIRELSGWVSAIRPAFASMKHYFLNRETFSYGIPEFDKLLKESDNFILYQENIMRVLVYVGFPEDETYGLLKAIAKKKKGIIEPIHDKFIKGFVEKTGSEEQAKKVWKIIEDAVGYGFNSSHAYAVALDSIYGAYLKAEYPLDYYSVVLNIYEDNVDMQAKILKELKHFNIKLLPIEFGKSGAEYTADHETNSIYKGISSIKYLNKKIAEELLQLSEENQYDKNDFTSLLKDIIEKTSVNTRQMEILIRLDFFKKFGRKEVLLELFLAMTGKKKANTELYPEFADKEVIEEKTNKKTGEAKKKKKIIKKSLKYDANLKETTKEKRLKNMKDYEKVVRENPPQKIELYDQINFEKEVLGYAVSTYPQLPDNVVLVLDVNTKYKPVLTLYKVKTGEEVLVKVDKKKFFINDEYLLYKGDIIQILDIENRYGWKRIDGKWVEDKNKIEPHLNKCKIIRRANR